MNHERRAAPTDGPILEPIAIAGIGAVTGYGWGRKLFWDGLSNGRSAARLQVVGEVNAPCAHVPDGGDPEDSATLFGRALFASCREAVADAVERGWEPGDRVGMIMCTSLGEVKGWRDLYFEHEGKVRRRHYLQLLPSTAPSMFMAEHGFGGPSCNVSAACASGNVAVIFAQQWLSSGFATDVVINATDLSITPENAWGFNSLGAVGSGVEPHEACRPFQAGSLGFVAGEASVSFVLTRNSDLDGYVSVLGGGMTHDSFHPIAIKPDGLQVAAAYLEALDVAGLAPEDVRYFNAHGTGTALNDWTEASVVDRIFADHTQIYSTKPLHGHCMGASAAVELAVAALTYVHDEIPAPDVVSTEVHQRVLPGRVARDPGPTLKSALGMGGYNSAVVLDRL